MTGIPALIIDMDGTVALNETDRPWYGPGYEKRLHEDRVNEVLASVVYALFVDGDFANHLLFVSGRAEAGREATCEWIETNLGYVVDEDPVSLLMRKDKDNRSDVVVKTEIYNDHILGKFDVRLALDDKPELITLWRSLGIPAWQVNEYR